MKKGYVMLYMLTSNQTVSLAWCLLLTTKRLVPRDSLHYPTVITLVTEEKTKTYSTLYYYTHLLLAP